MVTRVDGLEQLMLMGMVTGSGVRSRRSIGLSPDPRRPARAPGAPSLAVPPPRGGTWSPTPGPVGRDAASEDERSRVSVRVWPATSMALRVRDPLFAQ